MNRLQSELRRIDHRGYPAYKDLRGSYDFGKYILNIEHIQGDPFASPSSLSVKIKGKAAGFPKEYYNGYDRKTAFEDFILRRFSFFAAGISFKAKGSGKSGMVSASRPGQEIMERSACKVDESTGDIILRFVVGFPARGRSIDAGELEKNYVRSMQEYGTYVQQNYLEIPEEIKKTIKQLSCHVNKENSILYNIEEIQKFLKNNYQYTYRPGLTGQDKDPVNEFLTERKRGFCTQFASAAVFLFREAGIPARYVEGYKIRADQWRLGKAQVTDYEAHAWTEIYIEHIGWIPVEVTGRDTGESVYKHVEQEEKQRNAIVPNKKQFVTNVKKMFQMIPIVIILAVIFAFIKLLQRKRKWNQMTNKEKVLFYEKQLEKYAENGAKSRNNSNSMTSEIIEKARYSNKDITRHELNLVKRHLDLLKRKNGNVTKILTKLK